MWLDRTLRILLASYCTFLGLLKFVNGYSNKYALPAAAFYVVAAVECALGVLVLAAKGRQWRVTLAVVCAFFICATVFSLVHDGDCG